MKILPPKLSVDAIDETTEVNLSLTEPEDMWHANNLISVGDIVEAPASRKVDHQIGDTGSSNKERDTGNICVKVTSTFFDATAPSLHVTGKISKETPLASLGQFHTLDVRFYNKNIPPKFTLKKPDGWDSVARETLREAVTEDRPDALVAVVMQEGIANVCIITNSQTIIKRRVESSIPKKRSSSKETSGGMISFYQKTLKALTDVLGDFQSSPPILLASPGFVAQDFRTYMQTEAARGSDKRLQRLARDAAVVHSSTGYVHSLNEVLKTPQVKATMRDSKYTSETSLMDQFYERLRKDDGRAWYGVKPVEKAIAEGAVGRGGGVLLINNILFRSMDLPTRRRFVALVDKVKADGGEAKILSSDHESGQRLDALGGIAAILTYPIYDLDEDEDEDEEGEGQGPSDEPMII